MSAVSGSSVLWLAGIIDGEGYFSSMIDWWMGDSLGVVLMTPLILVWWPALTRPQERPSRRWLAEAALILGATLLVSGIVFLGWFQALMPTAARQPVDAVGNAYWMLVPLVWAALRLGLKGTSMALLLGSGLWILGIYGSAMTLAPAALSLQLMHYWFFSIIISLVALTLAVQIESSQRLTQHLLRAEASLNRELKNVMAALDRSALLSTVDVNRSFTSVNDNYCGASGYSRLELLGQEVQMLKSGAHSDSFYQNVYQTMADGRVWSGEVCNLGKGGHLYWLQSTISPFFGLDGSIEMYVAIGFDITARKLAEQGQRDSADFIRKIAAQVPGCIFQFKRYPDGSSCLPYASEGLRELHGLRPDEVLESADALMQSIHVEDRDSTVEAIRLSAQQLSTLRLEYRVSDRGGGARWMSIHAMPQQNDDGSVLWHGSITEVTQRKRSEIELQSHRLHLEELVRQKTIDLQRNVALTQHALNELEQQKFVLDQHAIVSVAEIDGSISYGNDRFVDISGYTRAEFIGQNHSLLNSGYHPEEFFKDMYQTVQAGGVWHAEVCNRRKDGNLFWVDTTIAAFMGSDGLPRQYIGVRTDITERKRAEEKSLAAVRAKSEFLANMSHEIRTPMNGVVGMVDILRETELRPEQQRMLDTIHHSSLSLLGILNDILDFSKIEAGKLAMESVPTFLREVAEGVAQLVMTPTSTAGIDISLFVSPQLPTWVLMDPTRLRQILLNMLGNAVKFITDRPGLVRLRLEPCTLSQGGAGLRIRISDNGVGMSPEQVTRLFQPFTQADASTSRHFGGTGLGLSITQRLVELMGGQIFVRSVLGAGSEFTVELPLLQATPGRVLAPAIRLDGVRVLGVTRDTQSVLDAGAYCNSAGAQIAAVTDLALARQWLQQARSVSGPLVVVLGLDVTEPPAELDLPYGVGVVRPLRHDHLDRGTGNEVIVPGRPLLYHDLIHAVALAAGRVPGFAGQVTHPGRVAPLPPTIAQARARGQLILLAEDNETNRDVMLEQLRLLGYAAEVACDGAQALQMWQSGKGERYGLLLTDCHMPKLDGFALTEAIRQTEAAGMRVPIIAVTANAMQGEARRCVERGMDDYLAKPLRLKELRAMLAKWLPLDGRMDIDGRHESGSETASPVSAIWDACALTHMVGDNPTLHRRLLEKFLVVSQQQVVTIGMAAASSDIGAIADVAHTLKSTARTMGAMVLGELCESLEDAGRADDAPSCNRLAHELERACTAACAAIRKHLDN